jgi:hypothetical protein
LVGFGYGFATWIGTWGGYWAVVYFIATHVHHRFVGWPVFAFVLLNGAVLIGSILLAFKVGAAAEKLVYDPRLKRDTLFEAVGMLLAISGALACIAYILVVAWFALLAYATVIAVGFGVGGLVLLGLTSR